MTACDQTVVCVLTPAGRGAVAVVGVEGASAASLADRFFRAANRKPLENQPTQRIVYGQWLSSEDQSEGEDLVVCRRSDTRLEIHCHGGSQSSTQIVTDLVSVGCAEITTDQWLQVQHDCPFQAAAHQELSQATTARTASILLDQYHGALRQELVAILDDLEANQLDQAQTRIEGLLKFAEFGLHLTKPWQVVIAGQPNVGKSSLINALVGFERAIVFDQPGTTRDVVTATTAIDGWPVQLSDTAGLHSTDDTIESAGIELARQRLEAAALIVWILDAREVVGAAEDSLWELATKQATNVGVQLVEAHTAVVINKCDLAELSADEAQSIICTSATNGSGIDRLLAEIALRLVPEVPGARAPIPFLAQQTQSLQTAASHLRERPQEAIAALSKLISFH